MNRKRTSYLLYIFILGYFIFTLTSYIQSENTVIPKNKSAFMDFSKIEFDNELLLPLNMYWLRTNENDTKSLSDFSLEFAQNTNPASYTLYLLLPEENTYYTLSIPANHRKYSVFINGEMTFEKISERQGSLPLPKTENIKFYAKEKLIEIKIEIAKGNEFTQTSKAPLYIALPEAIQHHLLRKMMLSSMYLIIFILSFVYYLAVYINNKNNPEYLSFSLLSALPAICVLTYDTTLLSTFLPNITEQTYFFLKAIGIPGTLIMLTFHFGTIFSKYINNKLAFINVIVISLSFIAIFLFGTTNFLGSYIVLSIIYLITYAILMVASVKAIVAKERYSSANTFFLTLIIIGLLIDNHISAIKKTPSTFFIVAFAGFVLAQIDIFLKRTVSAYVIEKDLTEKYTSAITQIKTEETNFLSSHLKAHFLFNALNIISGYSLFDTEKAKEITKALYTYLKQLFDHDNLNELNSLENEMELFKAFAFIELERFPGLTINYDIPEKLPDIMLPSLTLQPILENAINHGVRKKSSKGIGKVIITIRQVKKYVYFSIKDDGAGQDIDKLKKAIESTKDGKFHSLRHIQYRLNNLYNEDLIMRSIPGIGTFISFRIPI